MVLLCRMEQGEVVGWSDAEKIDRICRAHVQRHVSQQSAQGKHMTKMVKQPTKFVACVYFNSNMCSQTKIMKPKVSIIGIFVRHVGKYQFLEGLNSASLCDVHSYAQVVSQGVKKNAVHCKNSCWNVGTANRIGKIPNMGTHAGAHTVTMCNNSRYIEKKTGDQVSDVNKRQLMGKHQKTALHICVSK